MNKKLLKAIMIGAASLGLAGCTGGGTSTVSVESVSLNVTSATIGLGDEPFHLVATINPEGATNKAVTWTANNNNVRVDARGYVTAMYEGDSVVTVTTVDGGKTATCSVSVVPVERDLTFIGPVYKHQSYIDYETNIKEKTEKKEEFVDRTQGYFVGTDNAFDVKPQFTVYDSEGVRHNQDAWIHDYEIEVYVKNGELYVPANEGDYEVTDARNALIDFAPSAAGKSFQIRVQPGMLPVDERDDEDNVATYFVNVIEGYNAYTAKELSYLDSRHSRPNPYKPGDPEYDPNWKDLEDEDWVAGDVVGGFERTWDAFKTANGLDPKYDPKAVIMHENIQVTENDIPSNFFYQKGVDEVREKDYGTLKDTFHIYSHNLESDLTFIGNYLTLSYPTPDRDNQKPGMPLITRDEGTDNRPNSHTSLIRCVKGEMVVKNINVVGNVSKATDDADNVNSGGLMFMKGGDNATKFKLENAIVINNFITMMAEAEPDSKPVYEIVNTKCYDNYSSFLYNSGCEIDATNCIFNGVGGPILISDHSRIGNGTKYEDEGAITVPGVGDLPTYSIIGHEPRTKFIDCDLTNYVAGSEAWFNNYNASFAVARIKELNKLLNGYGQTYLSKMNDDGTFTPIANNPQVPGAFTGTSFFNLISLTKSSKAASLTEYPVCGDLEIINTKNETAEVFNYSQPDTAMLLEALAAQDMAKVMAYGEQVRQHKTIRNVNGLGSAAFQTGYAGSDYYYYIGGSEESPVLCHQVGDTPADFEYVTKDVLNAKTTEHLAMYYSGMQITFAVYKLG